MSPNKKVTKEVGIGEALKAALPRVPAAPLKNLPGAHLAAVCAVSNENYRHSGPNDGRGSALPALPIFLCTFFSGKKSGHFLPEQELL